jgi:phosphoribosylglycinamide formyltransferase-1
VAATIAVLASGGGSNLQALLEHFAHPAPARVGRVAIVVCDNPSAGALEKAAAAGIEPVILSDAGDGNAMLALLRDRGVDLVALAGYLKRVPDVVTRAYRGRMMNVHPSLLPAFGGPGMYGARVHQAVIAAGVRVSGVTVHFVDEQYDHGPIIAQNPVPVFPSDDADTLAARVLQAEHELYPSAVEAVAAGTIMLCADDRVRGTV